MLRCFFTDFKGKYFFFKAYRPSILDVNRNGKNVVEVLISNDSKERIDNLTIICSIMNETFTKVFLDTSEIFCDFQNSISQTQLNITIKSSQKGFTFSLNQNYSDCMIFFLIFFF